MNLLASAHADDGLLPPLPANGHWPREADFIHWCQAIGPGMAAAFLSSA